jgi:hypothetical protein
MVLVSINYAPLVNSSLSVTLEAKQHPSQSKRDLSFDISLPSPSTNGRLLVRFIDIITIITTAQHHVLHYYCYYYYYLQAHETGHGPFRSHIDWPSQRLVFDGLVHPQGMSLQDSPGRARRTLVVPAFG